MNTTELHRLTRWQQAINNQDSPGCAVALTTSVYGEQLLPAAGARVSEVARARCLARRMITRYKNVDPLSEEIGVWQTALDRIDEAYPRAVHEDTKEKLELWQVANLLTEAYNHPDDWLGGNKHYHEKVEWIINNVRGCSVDDDGDVLFDAGAVRPVSLYIDSETGLARYNP